MADKTSNQQSPEQGMAININPVTTPVLYTDNIIITTNEDGVVLDVSQRVGSTNQANVITRVGMSREHAKKFVKELGRILAMTEGAVQTGNQKGNKEEHVS
jgi:hypothetical protein